MAVSVDCEHRLILLAFVRAQCAGSSRASLTRVYVKNPKLHSADQFEDRAIRILEADHADHGAVRSLDLFEWRDKLNLLCLQICVGPVDIVDTEGDAADADVVEGRVGLALRRRVDELDEIEKGALGSSPRRMKTPRSFLALRPSASPTLGSSSVKSFTLVKPRS
jgi:hypothetical protein